MNVPASKSDSVRWTFLSCKVSFYVELHLKAKPTANCNESATGRIMMSPGSCTRLGESSLREGIMRVGRNENECAVDRGEQEQ